MSRSSEGPGEPVRKLLEAFRKGERRAAARLMSLVENGGPDADRVLHVLHPLRKGARRIGITGPPGVGKSTLVEKLILHYREQDLSVGVVAVDPSSPFSGGALLGDRVRMSAVSLDPEVFIRSMATRGSLGGLAQATKELVDVLDAFGKDVILIETVGVGQSELDVASTADSTVVVLAPESGDGIQAMKAGVMEVADLLVVNKGDREGASEAVRILRAALALREESAWSPPVVVTVATKGGGISELVERLAEHQQFLERQGRMQDLRRERTRQEIESTLRNRIWTDAQRVLASEIREQTEAVLAGHETPYSAAAHLLDRFRREE